MAVQDERQACGLFNADEKIPQRRLGTGATELSEKPLGK